MEKDVKTAARVIFEEHSRKNDWLFTNEDTLWILESMYEYAELRVRDALANQASTSPEQLNIPDVVLRSEQLQPDEEANKCKRCNCYGCVCDVVDGI